jgi:adenosylmethionine-8-amino-7-oxononanoate aminotransferase
MTGFGRTGPLFACDRFKTKPDITCLSKGLTGGFLPLGATVCSQEIYEAFYNDSLKYAFLHGHSYCGNPIACAAALASMDLYDQPDCLAKRQRIEKHHRVFVKTWGTHPRLKRCEVVGTILVLEYVEPAGKKGGYFSSLKAQLASHFFKQGIYLRPIGNILYLMPPYCTEENELESIYAMIAHTLEHPL